MKICLKLYAGLMTKEEFLDNLAAYRALREQTGFLFAEHYPVCGAVYVYYHVDDAFIAANPQNTLLTGQSYVEIGQ